MAGTPTSMGRHDLGTAHRIARVAAAESLVLREEGAREFRLSTKGLSEALSAVPVRCGGGRV